MLAGRPEQPLRVLLRLDQCCPGDEPLCRVPDHVRDGVLRVDLDQVLEDVEEGDLLRGVHHLPVDAVEQVQVRSQVHPVRPFRVGLVTLLLLVENVQLNLEVLIDLPIARGPDVLENLDDLESDELIPDPVPVLELGRGDDQAVDKGQKDSPVLVCLGHPELFHYEAEPVPGRGDLLVVVQSLQRPGVAFGAVDAESGQELKHLLLHLGVGSVEGCN